MILSRNHLGISHSEKIVFVQITLSAGRRPRQKHKLFRRVVELLAASPGVPSQDLIISLVEVAWENWSFGNGEAPYMDS
jgi:phenylpyruvate tautomerase PptA (4-oxalocrotonate tautomerase family)